MVGLQPGQEIGRYRIVRRIGEGGMGVVYECSQEAEPRAVAVKLLRPELAQNEAYRRRFQHEVRAAREVVHPGLVPIIDAGETAGYHYLAMPYIGPRTLKDLIHDEERLPVARTLEIASTLGAALDAVHERGLLHRDIKSSNVLLAEPGDMPMLSDFGVAKGVGYTVLTRTGLMVGTLDYLAPELIRGEPATTASDVYAFACLVYECLAGAPPFSSRSMFEVGYAHLHDPPASLDGQVDGVSAELDRALLRGLEKDPARRPHLAGAYADLLRILNRRMERHLPHS
jgi:serine/threonine protein kinase